MPIISSAINVGTEGVISPETLVVKRGDHVIFLNHGDCKVTINVPNDVFGKYHNFTLEPQEDSKPVPVSPQAPTGDNKFDVTWKCPPKSGVSDDSFGDGTRTGNIRVDN